MSFLRYADYLQLEKVLSAQAPRSDGPEHDETLFIIIHQTYELWFKQILHEADYLSDCLAKRDIPRSVHTLRRICVVFKTLVGQVDILETMTPLSFASFRPRLESASGFQSRQFRELEYVLGKRQRRYLENYRDEPEALATLERRLDEPSLYDRFLELLSALGHPLPTEAGQRGEDGFVTPSSELQDTLESLYRNDAWIRQLCERFIDLDEGLQEWRYRHVKMVERTIGNKMGTGGSSGAAYLRSTLFQPVFPDLWALRTRF